VSKASKKLRREAASAKIRATDLSIFAISATLLAPLAIAQEATGGQENTTTKSDENLTEILVTGIRKALATAQEIKKESDTVVDSITATDIGAFPDKSVAEALQRVSGITVTRFAASGDTTHFSAEPSGVVIRGLPFVRSEFNGRDSFNANSSRGLSFADVSPELMRGVDTYKNTTAEMIEGGLAGTVNLKTALPFDSQGFVGAFSGEMGYGTLAETAKPAGSILLSNRWDTGIGEFGVMLNAAYSEVETESQGVQLLRFFNATNVAAYGGGTKWIPGGVDIRQNTYTRTRKGASFATQWQSPEESLLATLQYNRSEYQNDWEEYSLTAGVGNSQQPQGLVLGSEFATHPAGTPAYEFDSRGVFVRGVINDVANGWAGPTNNPQVAHPNGYRLRLNPMAPITEAPVYGSPDWTCYTWTEGQYLADGATTEAPCPGTRGAGLGADTRSSKQTNVTEDLSLNFRWTVNDRLGLNFDVQKIDSTVVNFDNSSNSKSATDLELDISGGKPRFEFHAPTGYGFTDGGYADPQNWFHEWTMEHAEDSTGEEWASRIDADIKLSEDGWMESLRVGVRRAEREQNVNWSNYNWGAVNPLWGLTSQPLFLNQGVWQDTYVAKDLGPDLVGGGVFGGGTFLHPRFDIVNNYQATRDLYSGRSNSWVALPDRTNCPVTTGTLFCPVEQLNVTEDTSAAYIMLKFGNDDTKIGNVSVKGNVGLRFVTTDVFSSGGVQFPRFNRPNPPTGGNAPDPRLFASAEDERFMNFASYTDSNGKAHKHFLPSFNVRFGLTDEQYLRFAASRALARPDMGLYKFYYSIAVDSADCAAGTVVYATPGNCSSAPVGWNPRYSAGVGNPSLKPTTADQADFTYEWYFSSSGSFTAALFYKQFNDYVTNVSTTLPFTNNGVTRNVSVTSPINSDGAKVAGAEVSYQTFFDKLPEPWNGFGIQTNYTYVDNKGVDNSGVTTVSGNGGTQQDAMISFTDLPLEGFSKSSYNIVLMFEKEKYSGRLAYNWRDQYLIGQADCCIKLPVWQEAYGQLDASFRYKPSTSWDIFLDIQNLTEEETVLRQQVNQEGLLLPRSWFTNDMRLQLGVRYRIE
jgi:iron complex outermembrane receptor protein